MYFGHCVLFAIVSGDENVVFIIHFGLSYILITRQGKPSFFIVLCRQISYKYWIKVFYIK